MAKALGDEASRIGPISLHVEQESRIVETGGIVGVIFPEPLAADGEQGSAQTFRLGIMAFAMSCDPPLDIAHRRSRPAALLGQGGDLPEVLDSAVSVDGLPMVGAEGLLADCQYLLGRRDGLGEPARRGGAG